MALPLRLVSPGPIGARLRAAHAVDVPLALDLPGRAALLDDTPMRREMTVRMSRVWTHFARSGTPNSAGLPDWPAYQATTRPTMLLDTQCRIASDPERRLREAWDVLPPFHP